MVNKRTLAKTAVVTFGAAMTTMYAAPDLNASIVTVAFNPGSAPFGGLYTISMSSVGGNIGSFSQWNDAVGKTLNAGNLSSVAVVQSSQSLSIGTFSGAARTGFATSSTGTVFIGFRANGNVGWFSMNLGGAGGTIVYGAGEYGNAGEVVHVGGTAIPEPASAGLTMLALGAIGLRRRRKS